MTIATGESTPIIETRNLIKDYAGSVALKGVDLEMYPGQLTLVMGASGSGKTTLFNILTAAIPATAGNVRVGEVDVTALEEDKDITAFQASNGVIFQNPGIAPGLTVDRNIRLIADLTKKNIDPEWKDALTQRLGMDQKLDQVFGTLSGGEMQRTAIIGAMVTQPEILFADEPTGALDTPHKKEILGIMRELVDERGMSIVVTSHDTIAAEYADTIIELRDGEVSSITANVRNLT